MVQRKVANKIGIKPHHLKLDAQLVNLKPSSPSPSSSSSSSSSCSSSQTHEKLKKIMKKSRSIKRSEESPFRKKKTPPVHDDQRSSTPQKQSPNYMKSTSSFDARKEQSPKTPTPKGSKTSKTKESAAYGVKGSRTSSLKMVRSLTKTTSFKPLRSSKKVILCEDVVDAQRATCSSRLKEPKFPNYLQLNPGGTELDGTSAIKVCPYTYCSLNGHHHAPVPPLKSFLSARRRAMKTQKGFKLGCLSPRQIKPVVRKTNVTDSVILASDEVDMKEENRGFFINIYSKDRGSKGGDDLECSDIDWEEGYCFDSGDDCLKLQEIDGGVADEDQMGKKTTTVERLYDEESVSLGAWSEEDGDSASDSSCEQMKIDQDYANYDAFEVLSTEEFDVNGKMDEVQGLNHPIGGQNINYEQEETSDESKDVPDFAEKSKDEANKNRTTIIYNIIQFNISVFVNGEKTGHSETDKTVTVQVPATSVAADILETEEPMEEQRVSNEDDEASEVNQMVEDEEHVQDIASVEQLNAIEKLDYSEQECSEYEACNQSNSMDAVTNMDEEPGIRSDVDQTHGTDEITSETDIKRIASNDQMPDPCTNLRELMRGKKKGDDSHEFNPRGPNFLPETPDPDAETVDLRHQMIDERKNAEEWMVDFALQQAVTTLAPARKRKVALLVEAFEKVMPVAVPARNPIPMYETHNRHTSKAFTNARPMQACS